MLTLQPFPALEHADDDGLLAMGGDLSTNTLISAYAQGVFPWFNDGQPILWWSPDPRLVLFPDQVKISRSLKKSIKKNVSVTCNTAFSEVIEGCSLRGQPTTEKSDGEPTWITQEMLSAYNQLHAAGYAHSIETWQDGKLVGGLYGVYLEGVFFGESMFSRQPDASKIALVYLCQHLMHQQNVNETSMNREPTKKKCALIDCQVTSQHLLSLGAKEIPRNEFIAHLTGIDINRPHENFSGAFPNNLTALSPLFSRTIDRSNT